MSLKRINNRINKALSFLDNPYVAGFLKLFLVLYAGLAAPKLPHYILQLFDNMFVKVLILFLVLYTSNKDPILSLLIAVGFIMTLVMLNRRSAERFDNENEKKNENAQQNAIKIQVNPSCAKMTPQDIFNFFDNNPNKMDPSLNIIYKDHPGLDISNAEDAPKIASLLLQRGLLKDGDRVLTQCPPREQDESSE